MNDRQIIRKQAKAHEANLRSQVERSISTILKRQKNGAWTDHVIMAKAEQRRSARLSKEARVAMGVEKKG